MQHSPEERTRLPVGRRDVIWLFWLAIAHIPYVVAYFSSLWRLDHYGFFPFALLAFGKLFWDRVDRTQFHWTPIATALVVLDLMLATAGILLPSPFLVYAGLVCLLAAVCMACRDQRTGTRLTVLASIPLLLVRPPLGLDTELIGGLQASTTRFASTILHGLHVWHFRSGNVLKLHDKTLFVEEACSGVQSLFAVLFVCLLIIVAARRRWFPAMILLCFGMLWAAVLNVVRILGIALAWRHWHLDLTTGTAHDIWGYVCLGLAALLVFSSDRLILFVFDSIPISERNTRRRLSISVWNFFLGPAFAKRSNANTIPRPRWVGVTSVVAVGLFAGQVFGSFQTMTKRNFSGSYIDLFEATDLPKSLADSPTAWKLSRYETETRNATNSNGQFSNVWFYDREQISGMISCDHAFTGWHELETCYRSRGWRVEDRAVETLADNDWPCVVVRLSQPTGEHGCFVYSMFDANGNAVSPPRASASAAVWDRIMRKSAALRGGSNSGRTFQVQMFVETPGSITSELRAEILKRHEQTRDELRNRFVERTADSHE